MCDGHDKELEDLPVAPSTSKRGRRWVPSSELVDLFQMPADPSFEQDLERMGGEMIDPWE